MLGQVKHQSSKHESHKLPHPSEEQGVKSKQMSILTNYASGEKSPEVRYQETLHSQLKISQQLLPSQSPTEVLIQKAKFIKSKSPVNQAQMLHFEHPFKPTSQVRLTNEYLKIATELNTNKSETKTNSQRSMSEFVSPKMASVHFEDASQQFNHHSLLKQQGILPQNRATLWKDRMPFNHYMHPGSKEQLEKEPLASPPPKESPKTKQKKL